MVVGGSGETYKHIALARVRKPDLVPPVHSRIAHCLLPLYVSAKRRFLKRPLAGDIRASDIRTPVPACKRAYFSPPGLVQAFLCTPRGLEPDPMVEPPFLLFPSHHRVCNVLVQAYYRHFD